jgi:hypothetical protein
MSARKQPCAACGHDQGWHMANNCEHKGDNGEPCRCAGFTHQRMRVLPVGRVAILAALLAGKREP